MIKLSNCFSLLCTGIDRAETSTGKIDEGHDDCADEGDHHQIADLYQRHEGDQRL